MQALQVFNFNGTEIRSVGTGDDRQWVVQDVCRILELKGDPGQHTRGLDDDEKGLMIVQTLGGPQEMAVVPMAGLWSLILKSKKPSAKAAKRWLTHEVIPSILKTGSYSVAPPMSRDDKLDMILGRLTDRSDEVMAIAASAEAKVAQVSDQLANMEADHGSRIAAVEQERADRIKVGQILLDIKGFGDRAVKIRGGMSWSRFYRECQRSAGVNSLKSTDRIALHQAELALEKARELADAPSETINVKWGQLLSQIAEKHPPTFMALSAGYLSRVDYDTNTCTLTFPSEALAKAMAGNEKQVAFVESGIASVFGKALKLACVGRAG